MPRWQPDPVIYLDCFDRHFKVNHLGHNSFSYPLTQEEHTSIQERFAALSIPFVLEAQAAKCVMEGDWTEPANAKVSFQLPGSEQMFSIGNFNACLILKRYADGIAKALQKKGISASVELLGAYRSAIAQPAYSSPSQPATHRPAPAKPAISITSSVPPTFQQLSIFDLARV